MTLKECCISNGCESDKRLNLVHDERMKPIMNINDLNTIEHMEQFLSDSQAAAFLVASSKDECYRGIQLTLVLSDTFRWIHVLDNVAHSHSDDQAQAAEQLQKERAK